LNIHNESGTSCLNFVHVTGAQRARADNDAGLLDFVKVEATRKVSINFFNFTINDPNLGVRLN
jgi:hypothetical protein